MRCNACGKIIDTHTDPLNDAKPHEGDLSLCIYCGTLYAFDADLKLQIAPPETEALLADVQPASMKQINDIRAFIKSKIVQN